MFPRVSLTSNLSLVGTNLGDAVDPGNLAIIGLPTLSWTFLDFGLNRARVEGAKGEHAQALANYRQAVLAALRDAETAVSRFARDRERLLKLTIANDAMVHAERLTRKRFDEGRASLVDVLCAERQQLNTALGVKHAQASLLRDFVSLHKALGLGWRMNACRDIVPSGAVDSTSTSASRRTELSLRTWTRTCTLAGSPSIHTVPSCAPQVGIQRSSCLRRVTLR